MKRTLLFAASLFVVSMLSAQSFKISYKDGPDIPPGSTIEVIGDPAQDPIAIYLAVTNTSATSLGIKAKKVIHEGDTIAFTSNTFCWGVCYPPFVYEGMSVTIEADSTRDDFSGDYSPLNHIGKSKISYVFFIDENPDDSIMVTVVFNASPESIYENLLSKVHFSGAYPNPSNSIMHANYNLPEEFSGARIVITNLLGAQVKEVAMNNNVGTVNIPVSDLKDGIYFYSLDSHGQSLKTGKFIVKH